VQLQHRRSSKVWTLCYHTVTDGLTVALPGSSRPLSLFAEHNGLGAALLGRRLGEWGLLEIEPDSSALVTRHFTELSQLLRASRQSELAKYFDM